MEMSNCRKCKKLFARINDPICDPCKREEEELFLSVKKYLEDHPGTPIDKVAEATGATAKKIMGYLRDGRLELSGGGGGLQCRACGVEITTGHYCESCHIKVTQQLADITASDMKVLDKSAAQDLMKRQKAVMHTQRTR